MAVDFTYRDASVTLPLFRGLSPQGKDVFYIITDASDFDEARQMGVNYAPKLAEAIGSPGVQNVTLEDGVMKFAGDVDFSREYKVVPGDPPATSRRERPIQAPQPTINGHPSSRCRADSCSTRRWSKTPRESIFG